MIHNFKFMVPPSIFHAYDIRGKYPKEINEEIVSEIISEFLNSYLTNSPKTNHQLTILVGHDARLSSPSLYNAIVNGIKNYKIKIPQPCLPDRQAPFRKEAKTIIHNSKFILLPIGFSTTPMFYYLVNHYKADLGIMVTASHNPKEYNGLKVVGKNATIISGKEIYKSINSNVK